jgi:hypothetical protein
MPAAQEDGVGRGLLRLAPRPDRQRPLERSGSTMPA